MRRGNRIQGCPGSREESRSSSQAPWDPRGLLAGKPQEEVRATHA